MLWDGSYSFEKGLRGGQFFFFFFFGGGGGGSIQFVHDSFWLVRYNLLS